MGILLNRAQPRNAHCFVGSLISTGGSLLGGLLGGKAQSDAASDAAKHSREGIKYSTDNYREMWEIIQKNFAPFLDGSAKGLTTLTEQMPQLMNEVITPLAQQIAGYQLSDLPGATAGSVNPITGEIQQYAPMQTEPINMMQTPTGEYAAPSTPAPANAMTPTGVRGDELPMDIARTPEEYIAPRGIDEIISGSNLTGFTAGLARNLIGKMSPEKQQQIISQDLIKRGGTPGQEAPASTPAQTASPLGFNMPQITGDSVNQSANAMLPQVGATPEQLAQGGVLSPTVPDFQRSLEGFELNTDDPYYQTRQAQKNEEINAFLAKQGLAGSTAGETYRQGQMDEFNAGEYDRQRGYATTERNYLTQTDIDKHNMMTQRGDTLYGRQRTAGQDMRNNAMSNALTLDSRNMEKLGNVYNLASGIYGLQYGAGSDLAGMGLNAAANQGQNAMTTGQAIGNNAIRSGDALAQSALAQGQSNAQMWNMMGNAPMNYLAARNYLQPNAMASTSANYSQIGGNNTYGR